MKGTRSYLAAAVDLPMRFASFAAGPSLAGLRQLLLSHRPALPVPRAHSSSYPLCSRWSGLLRSLLQKLLEDFNDGTPVGLPQQGDVGRLLFPLF
jgi:hypothetical protein